MGDLPLRSTRDDLARHYHAEHLWVDSTLGQELDRQIARAAQEPFRIWSANRPYQGTIGDVSALAARMAGGLAGAGIGPGDVVAFQLPNCPEAVATFWATARLGAVLVPIVHFYGPKEVGYILRESRARALVTADRFGWQDFSANLRELRPSLPDLETVVTIPMDEPAPHLGEMAGAQPLAGSLPADPGAPALIAYTSGTTANPKGVIHTHRSMVAEGRQLGSIQPVPNRPLLNGAPLGHAIGMLAGILVPLHSGNAIHLADAWDPEMILAAMAEADIYAGSGATFFLQSLLDHPDCGPEHLEKMRYIGLGGASVPLPFAERASALGISIMRSYGSTEHPSTTGATHDEPTRKRISTDGRPLAGVELRVVDAEGRDLPPGRAGEIWSRGPDLCAGYTDERLTAEAFTPDGWYRTGDIGVLDRDGWLTITDRLKDVIIRGGETISAVEVEDLIAQMPGVAEVAVVAAPDERLGEHGSAFVRPVPGSPAPTLESMRSHLHSAGLARQKWPEDLRIVEDLPRTPSGKVRKVELREKLAQESSQRTSPSPADGDHR